MAWSVTVLFFVPILLLGADVLRVHSTKECSLGVVALAVNLAGDSAAGSPKNAASRDRPGVAAHLARALTSLTKSSTSFKNRSFGFAGSSRGRDGATVRAAQNERDEASNSRSWMVWIARRA